MRPSTGTVTAGLAAAVALAIAAPAAAAPSPGATTGLTRVSRGDPYAACTIGAGPGAVNYPGGEVEPNIAVDPLRPNRIVGAWQQDRWSDGGARGIGVTWSADGGRSFTETTLPVSECASGGLAYQRASDPWVSIGPDGTVYASALAFDETTPRNTVAASVSYDGGRTWRYTQPLINDTTLEFFNDKNSVTADPRRPGVAYQVWDRLDGGPNGTGFLGGPTMLSVTHDFGRTWSTPRPIAATAPLQQSIGNVILVDPRRGTLYDFYDEFTETDPAAGLFTVKYTMVRSADGGRTWSAPVTVAPDTGVNDVDPNTGAPLRTGEGLPSQAIDPVTGQLYVVYEGTDFTGGAYNQVQLTTSTDGGRTWSAPSRVNAVPSTPAMTPTVAVAADGTVGVTYSDLRTLRPGNTTTLPTSTWITTSPRGGRHFGTERRIAPVFDFLTAPFAGGYFVGDYEGLVGIGNSFQALFVTTTGQPANPTDVFTGRFPVRDPFAVSVPAPTGQVTAAPTLRAPAQPRLPATRH